MSPKAVANVSIHAHVYNHVDARGSCLTINTVELLCKDTSEIKTPL